MRSKISSESGERRSRCAWGTTLWAEAGGDEPDSRRRLMGYGFGEVAPVSSDRECLRSGIAVRFEGVARLECLLPWSKKPTRGVCVVEQNDLKV